MDSFRSIKINMRFDLPESLSSVLTLDINKFVANYTDSTERSNKLLNIISIFYTKYSDFIYNSGIISITNTLLSLFTIESDIFVILCYIFKNIFPQVTFIQDYLTGANQSSVLSEETKIFSMFAMKLRPKLVSSLSLEVKQKKATEIYPEAFYLIMQRLSENWFSSLFSSVLLSNDVFRVWDNILITGFEFAHKFGLALLSKYENFFRNSVKQEIKSLELGVNIDALILAGNISINKLLKKIDKISIETLIKKAGSKPTYKALRRSEFLPLTESLVTLNPRILAIRELKSLLESRGFTYDLAKTIVSALEKYDNYSTISRMHFQNFAYKNYTWDIKTVSKFFVIFDQGAMDGLSTLGIKAALSIIVTGTDNKLDLLYQSINQDQSKLMTRLDFIKLIMKIEENINSKSTFYRKNIEEFAKNIPELSPSSFSSILKSDGFFRNLLQCLAEIDSISFEPTIATKDFSVDPDDYYRNISSPEKSPISGTSDLSNLEENLSDFDLDHGVEIIGEKSVEIAILSNENNSIRRFNKPVETKVNGDHEEHCEIIKDPEFVQASRNYAVSEVHGNSSSADFSMDTQRKIEIPPLIPKEKERNSCSRLCTQQSCSVF